MSDTAASTNTVLKILNGVQAGVEVSLVPGEYSLGSGADDIQLIDVALKAGHARLRVAPGKIEIHGAAGTLRSSAGLVLPEAGDWQEVQPLDVLVAGTTRFALGPPGANWASITEDDANGRPPPPPRRPSKPLIPDQVRPYAAPIAVVALLGLVGVLYFLFGPSIAPKNAPVDGRTEMEIAQSALAPLGFARNLQLRREVDGTIFLTGYVESPVERRAVTGVIEATGVPVRMRIWVLAAMREEIARLIESQKVAINFALAPDGTVTLDGTLLDSARASTVEALVRDNVLGVAKVVSNIRTADTLLADARRLGQQSQIDPFVMLRLDGNLIEANGTIPVYKIDPWVGFLQAYATRLAKEIPLRSFVQLQGVAQASGETPAPNGPAIVIGENATDGRPLNVETLRQGTFKLSDVFVNQPQEGATSPGAAAASASTGPTGRPIVGRPGAPPPATGDAAPGGPRVDLSSLLATPAAAATPVGASPVPGAPTSAAGVATTPPAAGGPRVVGQGVTAPVNMPVVSTDLAGGKIDDLARSLLLRWAGKKLTRDGDERQLDASLGALEQGRIAASAGVSEGEKGTLRARYSALFAPKGAGVTDPAECWPGSRVKASNVTAAIFWLDLLSVSDSVSLVSFDAELQPLLLQAALDPKRVAACAARNPTSAQVGRQSVYLNEVRHNPDFVHYIVRDLKPYALDIVGADATNERFVQTRTGARMYEGAAPDTESRLAAVGELGAIVQSRDGWSAVIFGPTIGWLAQ